MLLRVGPISLEIRHRFRQRIVRRLRVGLRLMRLDGSYNLSSTQNIRQGMKRTPRAFADEIDKRFVDV